MLLRNAIQYVAIRLSLPVSVRRKTCEHEERRPREGHHGVCRTVLRPAHGLQRYPLLGRFPARADLRPEIIAGASELYRRWMFELDIRPPPVNADQDRFFLVRSWGL